MSPLPPSPARPSGRAIRRRAALAGAAVALLAIVSAPAALAADADVEIAAFAFDPASVTVTAGDSVTWTNNDTTAHTATGANGAFDSGSIAVGDTASVTFTTAGSYNYICTIHPTMTGTVLVEAAAGATAPPTDVPAEAGATSAAPALLVILAASVVSAVAAVRRLAPERRRAG